jgi:hypothetical protein
MKKMDRWLNVLWEIGQYTKVMTKPEIRALQEIRVFIFKEKEKKMNKEWKGIKVETSWCADDVRNLLGDDVKHMNNEEILEGLDNLSKNFHDTNVLSGWDIIEHCFKIKEKK